LTIILDDDPIIPDQPSPYDFENDGGFDNDGRDNDGGDDVHDPPHSFDEARQCGNQRYSPRSDNRADESSHQFDDGYQDVEVEETEYIEDIPEDSESADLPPDGLQPFLQI
jgi:hypothetical protein